MKRFRDDRPADICFARGTFNAHPYVMTAMDAFLTRLDDPAIHAIYAGLDTTWNGRAATLNAQLQAAQLPLRIANLSSIWTILYTQPSRYNWMFQYYARAEGLALSWIGSGRLIFSLNYSDPDFAAVAERLINAAKQMEQDGWWWHDPATTNKSIRRALLKEMLAHRF
jgi:glutamate-1-semialdehyde 2,1-aminomutase